MRIALCDDDVAGLKRLEDETRRYLAARSLTAETTAFSTPTVCRRAAESAPFDLYLLDILMPGETGVDVARRLREKSDRGVFVFFTTSPDFAYDAFGLGAVHYVLKPYSPDAFDEALDRAFRLLPAPRTDSILLKLQDGVRRLELADVTHVEADGHYLRIHRRGREPLIVRQPLTEFLELVKDAGCFKGVGRSLVVNLSAVEVLGLSTVLKTGERIAIPRRALEDLTAAFYDYCCR